MSRPFFAAHAAPFPSTVHSNTTQDLLRAPLRAIAFLRFQRELDSRSQVRPCTAFSLARRPALVTSYGRRLPKYTTPCFLPFCQFTFSAHGAVGKGLAVLSHRRPHCRMAHGVIVSEDTSYSVSGASGAGNEARRRTSKKSGNVRCSGRSRCRPPPVRCEIALVWPS